LKKGARLLTSGDIPRAGKNYNNTNAMGYHEYFQLCEDLGAQAVPVVNAGMVCQGRCAFDDHAIALKKLR
jgi:alpha-L-arabinofuranosidase